jgi:cytochrome d ubiquinol oxidase subunit II
MMILWVIIYSYLILSAIEYGTGYYLFYGKCVIRRGSEYDTLYPYLSPVSEITNFCFVLLFALVVTFSPDLFLNNQTQLAYAGILAIILILIKGTFFTLLEWFPNESHGHQVCLAGNGIVGVLIPPVLGISMVISEGGFSGPSAESPGTFAADLVTNVYFWSVMVIAVISIFYISAMYLTLFAHASKDETLSDHMRVHAIFWSMPTVLASVFVFIGLEKQNPIHFMRVLDYSWLFLLSLVCLFFAVLFVFLKRWYFLSFVLVMAQYFFALIGYTLSHLPYIIYPSIRIPEAAGRLDGNFWLLLIVTCLSFALVLFYLRTKARQIRKNEAFRKLNSK